MSYEKSDSKEHFLPKQKVWKNMNSNLHTCEKVMKIDGDVLLAKSSLA